MRHDYVNQACQADFHSGHYHVVMVLIFMHFMCVGVSYLSEDISHLLLFFLWHDRFWHTIIRSMHFSSAMMHILRIRYWRYVILRLEEHLETLQNRFIFHSLAICEITFIHRLIHPFIHPSIHSSIHPYIVYIKDTLVPRQVKVWFYQQGHRLKYKLLWTVINCDMYTLSGIPQSPCQQSQILWPFR